LKGKIVIAFFGSFLLLTTSTAQAAPKIKMVSLKESAQIQLSSDPNDQLTSLVTTPTSLIVAGTSAGDGYISAFDKSGQINQWSLHLGGVGDDIATAVVKENANVIWVVGASAVTPEPQTPTPVPTDALNPSGVQPETSTVLAALTQLDIWKVSAKGALIKSYSRGMGRVINPDSISIKAGVITVGGTIAPNAFDKFSITMDGDGVFSDPRISSVKPVSNSGVKQLQTTLSLWRSFVTSTPIKGLPSWKPKPYSHVLLRYDKKAQTILAAYVSSGEIVDFAWEKTIGIIALISHPTGYALAVIK
jgi:hypothetical protein